MLSSSTPEAPTVAPSFPAQLRRAPAPDGPDVAANVVAHLARARAGLESFAASFPGLEPPLRAMARLQHRLERPIRIGIAGEFNSGKSSLANLIVGIDSLPTAIVSNTRIPTLIRYAAAPEIFAVAADGTRTHLTAARVAIGDGALRLEVGLPAPRLRALEVVDLPGLADPRFDEAAIDLAAHGIDGLLWCTVATQAWKESERQAWSNVAPRFARRGLLVVTHRDLLREAGNDTRVLARLKGMAGDDFRDIVMLSTAAGAEPALIALPPDGCEKARAAGDLAALNEAIERFVVDVRAERANAAFEVVNRIAAHALARLEPARAG